MNASRWLRNQWDRAGAVAMLLVACIAAYLGWDGVSTSSLPTEQTPYLASGAVLAVIALGVAGVLWLSADLRDEWRKLDEIHQDILRRLPSTVDLAKPAEVEHVAENGRSQQAADKNTRRPLKAAEATR